MIFYSVAANSWWGSEKEKTKIPQFKRVEMLWQIKAFCLVSLPW